MREIEDVDLLVVGGGKAGKSLAMDRAKAGWKVAMVERDKIGGTCINVACIPTKSLVASARTLLTARHAGEMGIELDGAAPAATLEGLRAHKEGVVGGMVAAHAKMFHDSGMDFIMGAARFVGERTVEVAVDDGGTRVLRGRDVVINTGTTPAHPDIPGLADVDPWDSEGILRMERMPESIVILGGGYVGCEFASMLAVGGVPVTLVQGRDQLLPREDPDVAEAVADLLRGQGVDVRLGARATAVRRDGAGAVVALSDGTEVTGHGLLVALGRTPVTADLNLAAAGVEVTDRGFVVVDDHLRTTADRVWSAGDVAGSPQYTHASWNDFRILKALLTGGEATTAGRLIPYTVFTTPELARVGLTETEARAAGHDVTVARLDVSAIPRAKTLRMPQGRWKAVIDDHTDEILGVALLGHSAGEVVAAVQMAMLGHLTYQQVRDAAITHPTMAEGLNLLFDTVAQKVPA
jgi:pyruvate/2-oxoglutarate dehydrogenase complex dihydrolipoamide dehydrogenase (E3) component